MCPERVLWAHHEYPQLKYKLTFLHMNEEDRKNLKKRSVRLITGFSPLVKGIKKIWG
jgi:hypothetical protein